MIRRRIVFYGFVQGVGFRFRARHAAALFGCAGWVRNEEDGSVTLELQGAENAVDQALEAIERGPFLQIDRMEGSNLPPDPAERDFETL